MKTTLKHITYFCVLGIILLHLCGCASISSSIEDAVVQQSGIYDTASYKIYESTSLTSEPRPEGTVLVSFAANSDFSITYTHNDETINTGFCYVMPGDSISYKVDSINNSNNEFKLKGFLLLCHKDLQKEPTQMEVYDPDKISLPADDSYDAISILPIGEYGTRDLQLHDFYKDLNGEEQELNGTWIINGEESQENIKSVDSTRSYSVEYKYDNEKYYFINALPRPIASSDSTGRVVFEIAKASDSNSLYAVSLGSYSTLNLSVNAKAVSGTVKYTNAPEMLLGREMSFSKLKEGTSFTIHTKEPYEITIDGTIQHPIYTGSDYLYLYTVGKSSFFSFDPSQYKFAHGTVNFYVNDSLITEPVNLTDDTIIRYEPSSVEEGYYLSPGIITVNGANTDQLIKAIKFHPNNKVMVQLLPRVSGGDLEYFVEGERIKSDTVSLLGGQTINITLNEWRGWNPSVNTHELSYTVTEEPIQTVTFSDYSGNKISADELFIEADNHRPALTVQFGPSLKGKEILFDIEASALGDKYKNGSFGNVTGLIMDKYIDKKKIGTEKPIKLSIHSSKYALLNEAIKLEIKKYSDKGDNYEVRYITVFPSSEEIYVYPENQLSNPNTVINKIEITASLCNITKFTKFKLDNAVVSITPSNEIRTEEFTEADYIDEERKVDIKITPNNGYCVKDEPSGIYKKTDVAFKDIQSVLKKVKIQKQYTVSLNSSDEYGTCVYKRANGEVISGSINVNDKELISLEYTVTSPNKYIDLGWGKKANSVHKSLTISSKYNNASIDRSDFNIKVKG